MSRINDNTIKPFIVMEVLERALELEKEGKSIIHMEIGEPDFQTPKRIVEAGIESLNGGDTHYTDSRGTIELRTSIADYYNRKYSLNISPCQVLLSPEVFDQVPDQCPLWMPVDQARPDFIMNTEQIQLLAKQPVVPLHSFFQLIQVVIELFFLSKGGAVYPLQHLFASVAVKISARHTHQPEWPDPRSTGHVRSHAQVLKVVIVT